MSPNLSGLSEIVVLFRENMGKTVSFQVIPISEKAMFSLMTKIDDDYAQLSGLFVNVYK